MSIYYFDGIPLHLKSPQNFDFLHRYGTAFWCLDETGSGCVCLGLQQNGRKLFCKVAGADTVSAELTKKESVELLKQAVTIYKELNHRNLIRIVEDFPCGELYVALFEWAEGDCLFDHWNFDYYQSSGKLSPKERFLALPVEKKLAAAEVLFSFLQQVEERGYTAVDFYDGSILYDFSTDTVTLCDIDLFRKGDIVNDMGKDWFGTKRLKAPEEYVLGAVIDRQTNIFTLGALLFEFFGKFSEEEIAARYKDERFLPCSLSRWQLSEESYLAAKQAVEQDRSRRFQSFARFFLEWKAATAVYEKT